MTIQDLTNLRKSIIKSVDTNGSEFRPPAGETWRVSFLVWDSAIDLDFVKVDESNTSEKNSVNIMTNEAGPNWISFAGKGFPLEYYKDLEESSALRVKGNGASANIGIIARKI